MYDMRLSHLNKDRLLTDTPRHSLHCHHQYLRFNGRFPREPFLLSIFIFFF